MLDDIRFAAAGIARKDYVASLTHFRIRDGRITGFNGRMGLSSELPVDINAQPHGVSFLAAIKACGEETIALNMTAAGRLAVRAGKFRAYVNCVEHNEDPILPEGDFVDLGESFLTGIKILAPVMGTDASRPWAMGIKLNSDSMFATNNVIVTQFWHGAKLPFDVVIPANAVLEILRIGEAPTKIQMTENKITFWFGPKRWLLTTLLEGSMWPLDKIGDLLDKPGENVELSKEFFDAVQILKPFIDDDLQRVYVTATGLSTSLIDGEGAFVDVVTPTVISPQAYNFKQLTVLAQVATGIDWTTYPFPCKFIHKDHPLRGVMIGQRL